MKPFHLLFRDSYFSINDRCCWQKNMPTLYSNFKVWEQVVFYFFQNCHWKKIRIIVILIHVIAGTCSMFTQKAWTSVVVRAQWGTSLSKSSTWLERTPVKPCRWAEVKCQNNNVLGKTALKCRFRDYTSFKIYRYFSTFKMILWRKSLCWRILPVCSEILSL